MKDELHYSYSNLQNYLLRGGKETLSSLEACTSGGIQTEEWLC